MHKVAEAVRHHVAMAHPKDGDAIKWAKANKKDPRAMKILRLNGVK